MKPFRTIPNYDFKNELTKLDKHLRGAASLVREKNNEEILVMVNNAKKNAIEHYSVMDDFAFEKNESEFERRKNELLNETTQLFKAATDAIRDEPEVKECQKELNNELIALTKKYQEKNEASVEKYGSDIGSEALHIHQDEVGMAVFPIEYDALHELLVEGESKAVQFYETKMSKYCGDRIYTELRDKLLKEILKLNEATANRNKETIKLTLYKEKKMAFEELRHDVDDYLFFASFKSHARKVLNDVIGISINDGRLKAEIVEEFVDEACNDIGFNLLSLPGFRSLLAVAVCIIAISFSVFFFRLKS